MAVCIGCLGGNAVDARRDGRTDRNRPGAARGNGCQGGCKRTTVDKQLNGMIGCGRSVENQAGIDTGNGVGCQPGIQYRVCR